MSPRWGISFIRHDGVKDWHSFNMSEKSARTELAAMKEAVSLGITVVLWVRKDGKRCPQEYVCHKKNSRKHNLLSLMK